MGYSREQGDGVRRDGWTWQRPPRCANRTQAQARRPEAGSRAVGVSRAERGNDGSPSGAKPHRGFDALHDSATGHVSLAGDAHFAGNYLVGWSNTTITQTSVTFNTKCSTHTQNTISNREDHMADKKVIFVAFAIEDERQRDFLKGQSLLTNSPFEYIDMSVKEAYTSEWKDKVRTRIRRSDGVIALISKNSLSSSGQKWEIACAREEGRKVLGIWAYSDDRTKIEGVNTVVWTWDAIKNFINGL